MVKFLQNFSFIGGLLVAVLGVIMILIVNETGEEPPLLKLILMNMIFIFGVSIFAMLIIRSASSKK